MVYLNNGVVAEKGVRVASENGQKIDEFSASEGTNTYWSICELVKRQIKMKTASF